MPLQSRIEGAFEPIELRPDILEQPNACQVGHGPKTRFHREEPVKQAAGASAESFRSSQSLDSLDHLRESAGHDEGFERQTIRWRCVTSPVTLLNFR